MHVILAGRNAERGVEAPARIQANISGADVVFKQVDLGSLDAIAAAGARLRAIGQPIDILINNADMITPPSRKVTSDGFELQLGTHHLGHFALTGHLLPLLTSIA